MASPSPLLAGDAAQAEEVQLKEAASGYSEQLEPWMRATLDSSDRVYASRDWTTHIPTAAQGRSRRIITAATCIGTVT